MKKVLALMAMAAIMGMSASAQPQRMGKEEMQAKRAERIQNQAEKMANDFGLKDDKKTQFVNLYTEYQNALSEAKPDGNPKGAKPGKGDKDKKDKGDKKEKADKPGKGENKAKELTDEEATQRIEELFARQEGQIQQSQKRLEVNKAYYEKFKNVLTPQQIYKVLNRQQRQMQRGGQMNRQGNRPQGRGQQGGFGGRDNGGFGGPGDGGFGGDF